MAALDTPYPVTMPIEDDAHAVIASQQGYRLARLLGFSVTEQTALSIAILEITRNIVKYAGSGEIEINFIQGEDSAEIFVIAKDNGPGIPDLELALKDGYTTGKSLGLGLPGARRLMDEFSIVSEVGKGTTVMMKKVRHEFR